MGVTSLVYFRLLLADLYVYLTNAVSCGPIFILIVILSHPVTSTRFQLPVLRLNSQFFALISPRVLTPIRRIDKCRKWTLSGEKRKKEKSFSVIVSQAAIDHTLTLFRLPQLWHHKLSSRFSRLECFPVYLCGSNPESLHSGKALRPSLQWL